MKDLLWRGGSLFVASISHWKEKNVQNWQNNIIWFNSIFAQMVNYESIQYVFATRCVSALLCSAHSHWKRLPIYIIYNKKKFSVANFIYVYICIMICYWNNISLNQLDQFIISYEIDNTCILLPLLENLYYKVFTAVAIPKF